MKLLIAGIALGTAVTLLSPVPVPQGANYAGTNACLACHKGRNAKIVEGFQKSPLTRALMAPTDANAFEANFDGAPIKKEDVAWILCSGRNEQVYLDKDLKILPSFWSNRTKSWVTPPAGELPSDGAKFCLGCHTVGLDVAAKKWVSPGVGCEACHGPQGDHVKSPMKVKPVSLSGLDAMKQSMVCGRCHTAGTAKDGSQFLTGFKPGDDLDKLWDAPKEIQPGGRNQQFNEWRTSKHAANNIGCVTCHDPHNTSGQPHILKQGVKETCAQCHPDQGADMAKHAPTAKPGDTCATCHMPGGSHMFKKPQK